jgi:hypothetical protein
MRLLPEQLALALLIPTYWFEIPPLQAPPAAAFC